MKWIKAFCDLFGSVNCYLCDKRIFTFNAKGADRFVCRDCSHNARG